MTSRRRGTELGVLLLGSQLLQFGVDRIPPVTLGTIVLNVVAYFRLPFRTGQTCISAENVWNQYDLKRLLIGAIDHAHDFHLYYNMVSFLWKGTSLEKRFKSPYFAYILVVFTILTGATLVGMNSLLAQLTHNPYYHHQCAVGFSGVLFALKVLTTHYEPPGTRYVLNFIPVPSKWVYWAELVLIQVLVPNASFTGHLAGILVGLAYVRGPLKNIMDMFIPPAPSYTYTSDRSGYRRHWASGGQSGYSGHAPRPQPSAPYEQPGWYPGETRFRGASTPSAPGAEAFRDAPYPPSGRPSGQRLYPDLDAEVNSYPEGMTEEEQMRLLLERSQWDR